MHNVKQVPLSDERRKALIAASVRLGLRLEFALEGVPAYPHDFQGYRIPGTEALVPGAPPWAEDPRTLTTLLARVDQCLAIGTENVAC